MSSLDRDHVSQAIQFASQLADMAPEKYQSIVFDKILSILLGEYSQNPPLAGTTNEETRTETARDEESGIVNTAFDWSETNIGDLRGIAQILAILDIALKKFNTDGLSARTIQEILFQKFRVSKSFNNISMTLMGNVGKYVDRIKRENGYVYRITKKGQELVSETSPQASHTKHESRRK